MNNRKPATPKGIIEAARRNEVKKISRANAISKFEAESKGKVVYPPTLITSNTPTIVSLDIFIARLQAFGDFIKTKIKDFESINKILVNHENEKSGVFKYSYSLTKFQEALKSLSTKVFQDLIALRRITGIKGVKEKVEILIPNATQVDKNQAFKDEWAKGILEQIAQIESEIAKSSLDAVDFKVEYDFTELRAAITEMVTELKTDASAIGMTTDEITALLG